MNGIKAIFYREYKNRLTSPRMLTENILNPLVTLFIFGIALGRAVGTINLNGQTVPYISFFLAGAINISLVTNSMVAATKFFVDKYVGLFDEVLTYPLKRENILLGKMVFNSMLSVVQAFVMVFFIYLIEPTNFTDPLRMIIFFIIIIFGSFGWFSLLSFLALKVKTQDGFNSIYYLIMTPLIFISSVYYPIESMPVFLRFFCNLNPLTWLVDISRFFLIGFNGEYLVIKGVAFFGFILISFYLAKKEIK